MKNMYSGLAKATDRSEIQLMNHRIAPSAGETFWVVGHRVTVLPAGQGYTYTDVFSPARAQGPPPHRHTDCSELFHILEGRVDFTVGEEHLQLGPGKSVLVPPNVVHTFQPAGESSSRVITVFAPGGFDRWFRDMGVPIEEPNGRELSLAPGLIERILRDSTRYHMEIVGSR